MTHVICISLSDEDFENIEKMAQEMNMKIENAVEYIIAYGMIKFYDKYYSRLRILAFKEVAEEYEKRKRDEAEKNG